MTSIASNTPVSNTNSSSSPNVHARTPSISGQSQSAAVPANAPAPRALSYANVTKKPPTGPGAASSSNAAPQTAGGVSGQHARTASTTSTTVNGKISPAVPSFSNGGNAVINGATSTPSYSGGQHSRKSSIAAGPMPNGASQRAPLIKFGDALSETGSGTQTSGTAAAAGSNLTAPLATNPRSPSPSPSAVAQPAASGGAPPPTNTARPIQFGDNPPQQRPMSMPPQPHPPQGPNSMAARGHNRHDSTQSAHTDTAAATVPHGRGMPQRRGGHQGFNPAYQSQFSYGRGGYQGGSNQPRGGPPPMGGAPQFPQQYPGSPRAMPRSPALAHVPTAHHSPSMSQAVPVPATPQLYPPPTQPFVPGSPNVHYQHMAPQMYQDPAYYQQPFAMGYAQYAQTSPRPQYSQPVASQMGYPPFAQAQPMSRSSSSNVAEMNARPPSGIGHHPPPSMTPQPQSMVHPPTVGTPGPPPQSPYRPPKKVSTKAIEIRDPSTGAAVKIATPPVASAPVIVSSPSPAPGRDSSRNEIPHSRSTSRSNKTAEEKRREMREKVQLEAKKAEEEAKNQGKEKAEEELKKKEAEAEAERIRKEDEEKKREAEEKAKKEAEEQSKREAEKAQKEAEEKKAAEEKLRKEAEEKAQREAEEKEKAKKEAEEAEAKAKAEAEAKAKAAEAEAKEAAETKEKSETPADIEKPESPAPVVVTPTPATQDTESMPPPVKPLDKPRTKPSPLNLQIRTNEPGPPSAALLSLRSARPVENLKQLQYPEGIQSPNPALNPLANATKFKYDKEFLMQFQSVFTEKPSQDWDQKMRDTVGDTDSARPGTARTPSGMASRSSSSRGSAMPPMGSGGAMGAFGSGGFPKPSGLTSMERFQNSSKSSNPIPLMGLGSMSRPGSGIVRANSSTSLSGSSSNAAPQSPRTGNRSARGSSKRGAGGASMERSDSRQGPQPTIPLADVKPLPVSANRWTPRSIKAAATSEPSTTAAPGGQELMAPDMVQRKVKAALNKMTPEKFDKISDQILEITAQSKYESDGRTLRQVIQLTFEKACDESHWASMYAKFCKRMLETMDPNIKDENITDKMGNVVTGGNLFRKYLLNRCQEEFERGWKVNLPKPPEGVSEEVMMLSDEYYIAAAAKRRGLGLVQFIGELFKLGMLTERIMNECVRKLLDFEGVPEDETVESLSKLLRTIGHQLDNSEKSKSMMEAYFKRIAVMIENKELNSRMRFMLMDVVDLRRKGWETKEADKGPKTIQEVREEALKAQQEKEAASRANRGNRPQGSRGDSRQFSGGGYGNQTGYSDSRTNNTIGRDELLKLGNRARQASSGPSAFGPTSMLGPRGSGSRRGLGPYAGREDSNPSSRTATPPAPVPTSSPNPFSLLDAPHNDGNDATSNPPSNSNSPQVTAAKPVTEESK